MYFIINKKNQHNGHDPGTKIISQVSTYTKAIDTPFSSVRKADIRVSNPGLAVAAPYAHYGVAAPVVSHIASPVVSHLGVAPLAKVRRSSMHFFVMCRYRVLRKNA